MTLKVNCIFDALIYVYTDKDVKKLFLLKVEGLKMLLGCPSCWFRSNDVDPVDGTVFTPAFVLGRETAL